METHLEIHFNGSSGFSLLDSTLDGDSCHDIELLLLTLRRESGCRREWWTQSSRMTREDGCCHWHWSIAVDRVSATGSGNADVVDELIG
jgi:hypothetical protein